MKIDFSDIGFGIVIACFGIGHVVDSVSDSARRQECDKRGGYLSKVDDSWLAEKVCAIHAPKASKP